jgi:hypothetical protein
MAGVVTKRTVAAGTLPPSVQALTTHLAVWPRSMLVSTRCRATHRRTEPAEYGDTLGGSTIEDGAGTGPGRAVVAALIPPSPARLSALAEPLTLLAVLAVRAVPDLRAALITGAAATVSVCAGVVLGDGSVLGSGECGMLALGEVEPDDGSVVEPAEPGEVLPGALLVVVAVLGVVWLLDDTLPAGVVWLLDDTLPAGVVWLLDVVAVVGEGGGGRLRGSHCWLVPLTVVSVSAGATPGVLGCAADAATVNPAAVAIRTPPRTRLTPTGRTCAKRMKALPVLFVAACGNDLFSME